MPLTPRQQLEEEARQIAQFGGVKGTREAGAGQAALAKRGLTSFEQPKSILEGTLQEKPSPQAQFLASTKELPKDTQPGSLALFQSFMRDLGQQAVQRQPSPMDKLREFREVTGIEPISGAGISGTLEMGEKERLRGITETFRTTVDLMKEQDERKEKQRQENTRWGEMLFKSVENPLSVFSGDDIENMKLGIVTPEMQKKIQAAPQVRGRAPVAPITPITPEIGNLRKEFGKVNAQKLEQAGLVSADRQDQLTFIYGTPQEKEKVKRKITEPQKPTGRITDATEVTEFIKEQKEFGDSSEDIITSLTETFNIGRELATRLVRINF